MQISKLLPQMMRVSTSVVYFLACSCTGSFKTVELGNPTQTVLSMPSPNPGGNTIPTPIPNQIPTPIPNQIPTPIPNQIPTPTPQQTQTPPPTPIPTTTPVPGNLQVDGIHFTITGQTSVTFEWRGPASQNSIAFGQTTAYGKTITALSPAVSPTDSKGPFWEAKIAGLVENTLYHYAIAGGPDHTFKTPPPRGDSNFTITAIGDIGASSSYKNSVTLVQNMIASVHPSLNLMVGDLTYANANGFSAVADHFNDVMAWSQDIPYVPAWGNHEVDEGNGLINYQTRFDLANAVKDSRSGNCCGKDWHWFDYGNVRFIAYPEPWSGDDWSHWFSMMSNGVGTGIMDQAQVDAKIKFIVTFGHRPAWSTGYHPGDNVLQNYFKTLHGNHNKFVMNINGHSHNYERTIPSMTGGVTNITVGTGGGYLEPYDSGAAVWTAKRFLHYGYASFTFSATSLSGQFICGPDPCANGGHCSSEYEGIRDVSCKLGDVLDSFSIAAP